ncbi:hypothetical protein B0T14DRAFT_266829 [Immersiella caudata]|uniref:Uncharacterized protein n=1 Tax=Immersiella caudata TaxID=314043 RepID=A0AA40BXL7_9PEZI|nr:hypothetical protein B0T14DRAFT_266829 [Immersiella caudata]
MSVYDETSRGGTASYPRCVPSTVGMPPISLKTVEPDVRARYQIQPSFHPSDLPMTPFWREECLHSFDRFFHSSMKGRAGGVLLTISTPQYAAVLKHRRRPSLGSLSKSRQPSRCNAVSIPTPTSLPPTVSHEGGSFAPTPASVASHDTLPSDAGTLKGLAAGRGCKIGSRLLEDPGVERGFTTWCLVGRVEVPTGLCMKPICWRRWKRAQIGQGEGGRIEGGRLSPLGKVSRTLPEAIEATAQLQENPSFLHDPPPSQCEGKLKAKDARSRASPCSVRPACPYGSTDCPPLLDGGPSRSASPGIGRLLSRTKVARDQSRRKISLDATQEQASCQGRCHGHATGQSILLEPALIPARKDIGPR